MSKELHDEIMNLPCERTMSHFATQNDMSNYKEGHRNARHAAAELALSYMAGAAKSGNTSDNLTQVAANKAAEEGELPALPEPKLLRDGLIVGTYGYKASDMTAYARQAIAADRASRQVANKAEVGPVAYILKSKAMGSSDLVSPETARNYSAESYDKIPLYATPPATTGASTARDQVLEEAAKECEKMAKFWFNQEGDYAEGNKAGAADCANLIRQLKGAETVGASTVLTDERIAELFDESGKSAGMIGRYIRFARAIEREIAARAGQVAVPGDLTACANCLRPKCEHNGKLCPRPFTTHWHAWDYENQTQPDYPEYATPSPAKESK